ncbi:sulfite exporter TauE/SafE family protein [Halalkalibacterium halodurans]|jgi:uncharacterized membrane protein YfcA|uniref:Probable membrane transporter protein n=2 Tax=Halalkalibacterium halodurans TaxID=86665 RepID=Q9K8R4_HALH5|nr:sulfite exporter TauE/SafE family protein [Halalkalibacterium halodurans]MDY7223490.1 sulfite exporter TauE/SafE family protein [Halalkalibacterium halodurans]MDY7242711.1 sulfite exporter TauE/SafE family protein [Halalkalibacterium halodurans]MED3646253.1 sulfite exporter TauE/SafE family protein [Halalkalibacterium halodurans]MED4081581.1 sulfite exporter TauE/SafE family protein [Halalkalibacterium halodurans]MED4085007.1 sulfite exporter TauE/SafE family protein [Halalkalibacterium hal
MWMELIFIFLILLVGSFVQGVSGFGFGIIAMSFLPFFFTIKESTLLVVALGVLTALFIVIQLFRHIRWKDLIVIMCAAIIGRYVASFVLTAYGEMDLLKSILGVFLLIVVGYLFWDKPQPEGRSVNQTWLPATLGFFGGLVGGVFAVGGPFFVFYFMLLFRDDKYAYSANLQVSFFITNFTTVVIHGVHGDFTQSYLIYLLVGLLSVFIGTRLGVYCFTYLSQKNIRRLAGIVVAIAALSLVFFS